MLSAIKAAGATAQTVNNVTRFSCVMRRRGCFSLIQSMWHRLPPDGILASGQCHATSDGPRSQSILLQPAIKSAPAQSQSFGRLTGISIISGERFFDQKGLYFFQTHVFEAARIPYGAR